MDILLAEDERSIAVTLRDALEAAGHKVESVREGRSALVSIENRDFDVIVTDVRMPGASGIEVLTGRARRRSTRPKSW